MNTIYDQPTRELLIRRIHNLSEDAAPVWGKMNVHQMLRHCVLWEEMMLGRRVFNRQWVGLILGKWLLKNETRDDKIMRRNNPTVKELKPGIVDVNFTAERSDWIELLNEHDPATQMEIVHPFFGKMTVEQIGYHVFKHTDHHLRQFNV